MNRVFISAAILFLGQAGCLPVSPAMFGDSSEIAAVAGTYYLPDVVDPMHLIIASNGEYTWTGHVCDSFSAGEGRVIAEDGAIRLAAGNDHGLNIPWAMVPNGVSSAVSMVVIEASEDGIRTTTVFEESDTYEPFVLERAEGRVCAIFDGCYCLGLEPCDCNDSQIPIAGVAQCADRPCG